MRNAEYQDSLVSFLITSYQFSILSIIKNALYSLDSSKTDLIETQSSYRGSNLCSPTGSQTAALRTGPTTLVPACLNYPQGILRYKRLEATLGIQKAAGSYRSSYSIHPKSILQER